MPRREYPGLRQGKGCIPVNCRGSEEFVNWNPGQKASYDCGPCHTTGYKKEGNQLGKPGLIGTMKTFLFLVQKANLEGKVGGAFGSYTHSGDAPNLIFDTMENVFKMEMIDLGSLNLLEHLVDVTEGLRACQDYGRAVGEKLGK